METQGAVIAWFRAQARDLPWRNPATTPWQVLVSEIMLQQTPAARVAPAYLAWISRWPTAETLAQATRADVLRQWDRLGYPSRALRLHAAAIAVTEKHGGVVPKAYEELVALPGVGDYTASAIQAFAYRMRSTVLDTNIRRVIARVWHGQQFPGSSISAAERCFAEQLVPATDKRAAQWSAAVMELGAVVCTARAPQCGLCPIAGTCAWQLAGAPQSDAVRHTQKFEGTDRQIRGRMMRKLRESSSSLQRDELLAVCEDATRASQVLDSLVVDGLAEVTRAGRLRLPH